ncbi:2-hydroxy-3-oxopropionate reductase [Methylobacterium indicum]|uniref:3-hydroxyisobutyrate dehydrogenase n=1 Tax=Methylobacterium indicum TaxID=1775910 RepID=A0A8H9C6N6_9HYPH|nr:NAD(P)-dependent oxidoreductase [Methylobacterium indicum]KTS26684.1 2-hydroxy-3-oxopropionate reductase [Methylobacterium indicum]KTS40409.1 2-hydroxy-3-oxopropionate reductase [Methylobacterium indicum]KTS53326.1 2-hydroxy-3-oxopropionate reductase [Methylobacterium indicum]BCM83961.1 3-hydroxyisobutyrate dehydrogenase [Methylobacterium indicum]
MSKQRVGIVGVGLMGHGIALNLARKGWPLGYLDHPGNQPTDDLDALGAARHPDRTALAKASEVVILCVTGTPQVEDVLLGDGGVLASLRPGTVVVDCSTAVPASTAKVAAAVREAGGRFLDAPMTRTPKEAAEGRLNLLVGAEPELFEAMHPLLSAFAENIFHAGAEAGAGHTLKLLHNYVSLGFVTLLAESAACAGRAGIAPEVLVEVLRKGGGHGAALDRLSPFLISGDSSPMQFSIANARKDLNYYVAMAEGLGAERAVAAGVLADLDRVVEAGHGTDHLPRIVSHFAAKD